MTQEERLDCLLRYLLAEREEYKALAVPAGPAERRRLLRALLNVRPPEPLDRGFYQVQDAYLQEELRRKGVTRLDDLCPVRPGLYLWQGDITTLAVDAIVNAANSAMLGCFIPCHGCVDNAIHTAAGFQLRRECARMMALQPGEEPPRPGQNHQRLQPALPVCAAHGGAHRPRGGDGGGPGPAGLLLPVLPGAGCGSRMPQRGLLLYLHRRIPFSG